MMVTKMQYGHWGINVSTFASAIDYAPIHCETFGYPVSNRGPIDSAETEQKAIEYCRAKGGEVKGPFFYRE